MLKKGIQNEDESRVRMNGMVINVLILDLKQISINNRSKPTLSRGDKCHNNFLFCLFPPSFSQFILIFTYYLQLAVACSSLDSHVERKKKRKKTWKNNELWIYNNVYKHCQKTLCVSVYLRLAVYSNYLRWTQSVTLFCQVQDDDRI